MSRYTIVDSCQIRNLPDLLEAHIGFKEDGRFVEVGAEDGIHCSNTWTLAELGWKGLAFEPNPLAFGRAVHNHLPHAVTVVNLAIAAQAGPRRLYLDSEGEGSCSTLYEESIPVLQQIGAQVYPERFVEVQAVTMDWALEHYGLEPGFDLLSVDAECGEEEVLAGFSIARWKPRVMVWELKELHPTDGLRRGSQELAEQIEATGYRKVQADMLNSVFVRNLP